jgi:membrane-associated phospholipid phosphatase
LKRLIKQPRPDSKLQREYARSLGVVSGNPTFGDGSTHSQYGMPSAHTQFMFFVALCLPLILRSKYTLERKLVTLLGWVLAIFVSYSRVKMEHHTTEQVLVGMMIGLIIGSIWRFIVMQHVVERFVIPLCKRSKFITDVLEISSINDDQGVIKKKK